MQFFTLFFISICFLLSGCSSTTKIPAGKLCNGTQRPYEIKGIRYTPQDYYEYDESGIASWYGPGFHQRPGSCGTKFDMHGYTAAHKTLPIPSVVEVTNIDNGKKLHLVINDRGPFVDDRIIDLSKKAAAELGTLGKGLGHVRVKALPEQSVALASYLKQYGRYGRDPLGRGWDQIYRDEIAGKHGQYVTSAPKISKTIYHPEGNKRTKASSTLLRKPAIGLTAPRPARLLYSKNQELETLLDKVNHESASRSLMAKAHPTRRQSLPRKKTSARSPAPSAHYIRIGNFTRKQNAVKTQQKLRHHGNAVITSAKSRQGQSSFTVKLGPYASKKQAKKVMETIARNGYHGLTLIIN